MKEFLAAVLFIGLGVLGMCVALIFKKGGRFPDSDISSNEELRRRGIRCLKEEDQEMWDKELGRNRTTRCGGEFDSPACRNCRFFEEEKRRREKFKI